MKSKSIESRLAEIELDLTEIKVLLQQILKEAKWE